jgi:hypothetical protein
MNIIRSICTSSVLFRKGNRELAVLRIGVAEPLCQALLYLLLREFINPLISAIVGRAVAVREIPTG